MNTIHLEQHARAIYQAGVEAVTPSAIFARDDVRDSLESEVRNARRVAVLAFGKAAEGMLREALNVLPEEISAGILVVHERHGVVGRPPWLPRTIEVVRAGHPMPSPGSLKAGRKALELAGGLEEDGLFLLLISGGGSAMLAGLVDGISLDDLAETTRLLLASGATISEVNSVRKHLSTISGGRLSAAAYPARVSVLAISDVRGDDPSVIASGPTIGDPTTYTDALAAVEGRGLHLPDSVVQHLRRGSAGDLAESIKPGDERLSRSRYQVVASNENAVRAAIDHAENSGYNVIRTDELYGEASDVGAQFAEALAASPPGTCLIAGGETTVTLGDDPGKGGRNQEFVLAAALALANHGGQWCVLSGGTDGIDGVTDAAGGVLSSRHLTSAADSGLDAQRALRRHDAYPLLSAVDGLLVTGATGTNVMDLAVGITPADS